ncbi:MAG: LysM peptidoglycan-binding domain-containing protein [Clostridium sp.]|nr:LysM peptidoglycan-binding domain-containing protein [Acetatifactor muris]MCM1526537.1 LysM peptidoglycan-binding domain-containing protein [Bacteroides sp.]MCM1562337.1 LysM peptidoglycan-binding domain-containing protein [Clostridium sp.]
MREQKSIREMTDRELRTYKRDLRRRKERRRRIASFLMTICLITVCVISCHSFISKAGENTDEVSLKYYTGITVMDGDSLWSIADEYIDYEQYRSRELYIEEVCSINRLEDASGIRAGQRLIVPYYSTEFVK